MPRTRTIFREEHIYICIQNTEPERQIYTQPTDNFVLLSWSLRAFVVGCLSELPLLGCTTQHLHRTSVYKNFIFIIKTNETSQEMRPPHTHFYIHFSCLTYYYDCCYESVLCGPGRVCVCVHLHTSHMPERLNENAQWKT